MVETMYLVDLDELLQKIRNSTTKKYIADAIKALRIGAYRSSIVITWVAVCVDIIEKIKELSLNEDKKAQKLEKEIQNNNLNDIQKYLKFEKEILNYACDDLEFISPIEKKHFERLREDRNICAHLNFLDENFEPHLELVKPILYMHVKL